MKEFDLIDLVRRAMPVQDSDVLLGIGDDCAQLRIAEGHDLITTTDTLNADIHFPASAPAEAVGFKSLAVSLSDVASMGAKPRWALLNLTLPRGDADWVAEFIRGFSSLAARHGVCLVGGDTTRGPLSITVTVLGLVPRGEGLRRSAALPGDLIAVSGNLGSAALALRLADSGDPVPGSLRQTLERPEPRVELGMALAGRAHACIDLSDGLLADLGHVSHCSGCAAEIELEALPAAPELAMLPDRERWNVQVAGGDDYELCFTVAADAKDFLEELQADLGLRITVIGRIAEGAGVCCLAPDGAIFEPDLTGFDHFLARS